MKRAILFFALALSTASVVFAKTYRYDTVPGDPLKTRIYTLDNGLKVFLSRYAAEPRIQTYIAVRVGSKNDPSETTGLSHYLEHLLFKGTPAFGSSNYSVEKPMLDDIERRYEVYRTTTDPLQRTALYHGIDSVSGVAAGYAIANEYDKLMSAIGANGTNAYTSNDATVYQEDIPANQLETWAKIEGERFREPVIRLFHTELEAVYEEYNRSLTSDGRKVSAALLLGLFPNHPYGTQTTLGRPEHLKNPSITNIKRHFSRFYVPNNMAVCMSGDFQFDEAIATVDKYFGALPKKPLTLAPLAPEKPLNGVVEKTVYGPEAENIVIGFPIPGDAKSANADLLKMLDMVLCNSHAGLIDLNINQQQKLLHASSNPIVLKERLALTLRATPKQGQTLEEAKALLLDQIDKLKKGEFDDWLLSAVVNDFQLEQIVQLEHNAARASAMVGAFTDDIPWAESVHDIDRLAKITKAQVVKFANENLGNSYVVVYKRTGVDSTEKKIDKPAITPVSVNRDAESKFVSEIRREAASVKPIEPVFLDFKKDMSIVKAKSGIEVLYKQNVDNELFEMLYVFDMGSYHDKQLPLATSLLKFLGTNKYSATQLQQEFYKLGCLFSVSAADRRTYVSLNGLSKNMLPAMQLFEHLLANAKVEPQVYEHLVNDLLKSRANAKLNANANFSGVLAYGRYGALSPTTNIISEADLKQLNPQVLVDKIHKLTSYKHRVFYYGPQSASAFTALLNKEHATPKALLPLPAETKFVEQPTTSNKVFFGNYNAKQIQLMMLSKLGRYDKALVPISTLYNEYFGGSMNAIVFQELREARGLAYTAQARYSQPSVLDRSTYMQAYIGTQTDKMGDAVAVFQQIINDMPESQPALDIAKTSIIQNMRTQRIRKSDILWAYDAALKLGLDYDIRRDVFAKVPTFTLNDVKNFQQKHIKNLSYTFCIVGDEKTIDFNKMATFGAVERLTQEQIFGY